MEDHYGVKTAQKDQAVTIDTEHKGSFMSGGSASQKQIFWTTTNKYNFADAGPLDRDIIEESRRSAQHLSSILRKALKGGDNDHQRTGETRTDTINSTTAMGRHTQTITPLDRKNSLVKTPSVPLVHGNSDFHLMRYK